jgi:hypothetical protein
LETAGSRSDPSKNFAGVKKFFYAEILRAEALGLVKGIKGVWKREGLAYRSMQQNE